MKIALCVVFNTRKTAAVILTVIQIQSSNAYVIQTIRDICPNILTFPNLWACTLALCNNFSMGVQFSRYLAYSNYL